MLRVKNWYRDLCIFHFVALDKLLRFEDGFIYASINGKTLYYTYISSICEEIGLHLTVWQT